ncbi:hypothetical protein Hanom_Chr14g01293571 [Helianthus anomalus]
MKRIGNLKLPSCEYNPVISGEIESPEKRQNTRHCWGKVRSNRVNDRANDLGE